MAVLKPTGRNLFLNSGNLLPEYFNALDKFEFTKENSASDVPSKNAVKAELKELGTLGSHGVYIFGSRYMPRIVENEEYTVSVYLKASRVLSEVRFKAEWMVLTESSSKVINITEEWQKFTLTGIANKSSSDTSGVAIVFYSDDYKVGDILYISSPKVEFGPTVTEYRPAPEDIQSGGGSLIL